MSNFLQILLVICLPSHQWLVSSDGGEKKQRAEVELRIKMVQSKWILSLLFLTMLQLEAATAERKRHLVQANRKATLRCENVNLGQKQCQGTTWMFTSEPSTAAVELFQYGGINEGFKEQSHRLSLDENCSLVIKNVTVEDAGSYVCQQWSGTKGGGNFKLANDTTVDLSVVTVTEQRESDVVTFTCRVSPVKGCPYTVKWQLGGSDIVEKIDDIQTSSSSCFAAVKVWRPCDNNGSRIQHLKCGVKNNTGKNEKFFKPPSMCKKSGRTDSVTSPKTTTPSKTWIANKTTTTTINTYTLLASASPTSVSDNGNFSTTAKLTTSADFPPTGQMPIEPFVFYISGVAVFVAVVAAVVIGWKIKKKRKEKTDIITNNPEDVLSYATISFKRNGADTNVHHEDKVTYSTVRDVLLPSSSSSSAAHVDVYAQINKP